MSCGVYEIWIDDYFYQGSSKDIETRMKKHLSDLEKNKHYNPKMQNVFNKHKKFEWHILIECDKDIRNIYEQEFININIEDKKCLNINPSATIPTGGRGKSKSEEHKEKISKSHIGKAYCLGAKNGRAKEIEIDGVIYETIKEAAIALNVKESTMYARFRRASLKKLN